MKYKNDKKILLILDLDETLIYATEKELNQKEDFKIFEYFVYKRPNLNEFLQKVKNDFLIAIWSSASDDYVKEISKRIIPKELNLEFVWGRTRCTYQRNLQITEHDKYYNDDIRDDFYYTKPLKKVKRKGYNLDKTLIVDDSPHKLKKNFGNAIYPKAFTGNIKDNELKLLTKYLNSLKDKENVRRIEKRNWQNKILLNGE